MCYLGGAQKHIPWRTQVTEEQRLQDSCLAYLAFSHEFRNITQLHPWTTFWQFSPLFWSIYRRELSFFLEEEAVLELKAIAPSMCDLNNIWKGKKIDCSSHLHTTMTAQWLQTHAGTCEVPAGFHSAEHLSVDQWCSDKVKHEFDFYLSKKDQDEPTPG